MSHPKFNPSDLVSILAAGKAHAIPIPSFEVDADAVKAFKYKALSGSHEDALAYLRERFAAMLAVIAPKQDPKGCLIRIVQGLPKNGSLKSIALVEYKQEALTMNGKTFAASLDIAQECLDNPRTLALAVSYGAVSHTGAATGVKVSSNRARCINAAGSALFGALGMTVPEERIKSTKGQIHGLYGYVPTPCAIFLEAFDMATPIKFRGARPNNWTWTQLVTAIQAVNAQGSAPSDWIKLKCECDDQTDEDGETVAVLHGARFSDVVAGYFRACCLSCGSGWRLEVDDNGKPAPVLVRAEEAATAINAERAAA